MPESEPKPKLIELVAPGAGQGWKAVLRNGKPAVVHEIPVPPAEAQAAVPRLQRLYDHRHPALSPVLAWGTDQQGVWVAAEPNEGTPLGSILSRGPLTPPAAAALGAAVLSGVAALHEAGVAMGGFGATAVRVTQNGDARIAGHPAAAVRGAPSQSDLRADVRSCGMAVCAAFGVDPAGAPAPQNIPPGLVVTMRSMASGAMGPSADRAQGAFREMAAALLAPDRQVAAQTELATRAGGREVPPITPFLPKQEPAPAAVAPSAPTAPYTPPVRREETPVRRPASYDAPDRPLQTYPAMPAITFPPAPAPAAPAAAEAPPAPAEAPPAAPAVPTWSEAPPTTPPSPFDAPATPATSTNPPAPAPAPEAPAPVEPPKPTWTPAPVVEEPMEPAPTFAAPPPPPVPAPPAPLPPASAPEPVEPAKPSWQPLEPPAWKPGETLPPETLGTGVAAAEAPAPAPPAPMPPPFVSEPPPLRPPSAPVRRPSVPRPPSRGGGPIFERPPWLVPAAVAAIIVILLGIVGVIILSHRGGAPSNNVAQTSPSAHASPSATSRPSASPSSKAPQTVPTYGPANADPITKIQFCTTSTPCKIAVGVQDEKATACDLNSCYIEVALYFSGPQRNPVHYNLKFFDRCTGQTTDLPGPSAYSPPGYAVVIPRDHWQVNIPTGVKSGALVAVSDQPSTAASAPLLLGAESC